MIGNAVIEELQNRFRDLINYEVEDPSVPIDPLSYRTPENDSCLHLAAMRGDYRSVELLLDAGLDVDSRGDMGNTALHYAKQFGHHEIAELLIRRGASVNVQNQFGKEAG